MTREGVEQGPAGLEGHGLPSQVGFVADGPCSETGKTQEFRLREESLRESSQALRSTLEIVASGR